MLREQIYQQVILTNQTRKGWMDVDGDFQRWNTYGLFWWILEGVLILKYCRYTVIICVSQYYGPFLK